jgi:hypothetical protein
VKLLGNGLGKLVYLFRLLAMIGKNNHKKNLEHWFANLKAICVTLWLCSQLGEVTDIAV